MVDVSKIPRDFILVRIGRKRVRKRMKFSKKEIEGSKICKKDERFIVRKKQLHKRTNNSRFTLLDFKAF